MPEPIIPGPVRSRWFSDDRVNALVRSDRGEVLEVGYHGMQPVSRNSRLLAGEAASLEIRVSHDGDEWFPFEAAAPQLRADGLASAAVSHADLRLDLRCEGRTLLLVFSNHGPDHHSIDIRFDPASLFTAVQGRRTWREPRPEGNRLLLECTDEILLDEWMQRSGPYAGDFLLPEHWRRAVFTQPRRSGFATADDLAPWAKDKPLPVYRASVYAALGGLGFTCERERDGWHFRAELQADAKHPRVFDLRFGDTAFTSAVLEEMQEWKAPAVAVRVATRNEEAPPRLMLPGYPALETFFSSVPDLVASCTVKDAGMPRACPGAYYWIWAWDSIVTAMEYPRWGALAEMRKVITFLNAHRDADGRIPGRWTRDFLPLDTPYRGGLEFLFLQLVSEYTAHSGDEQPLLNSYPYWLQHFDAIAAISDDGGLFANYGFYPDLPARLGRTERHAVAMEVAAQYAFCRGFERHARTLGDESHAQAAREQAERIRAHFLPLFLDGETGLLADAAQIDTGERTRTYPLFTLLALQSSDAFELLGDATSPLAAAIAKHHLTPHGIGLVPAWDAKRDSEPAMQTWYPHWDLYALKLFRHAVMPGAIMDWLALAERALGALGCCPEFLALPPFERGDTDAWTKHGALSNLNCATGWYRGVIEAVLGLRLDGGSIEVLPCALPLGDAELRGLRHCGATWDIAVRYSGSALRELRIDGITMDGLVVPAQFFDGGRHSLEVVYE